MICLRVCGVLMLAPLARRQVAEVMPNELAEKILRQTRSNLDVYIKGVSNDDLKRSPENRAALFGAMDHIRCAYMLVVMVMVVMM